VILPDVNILVYAFRREAEQHERYAAWLAAMVAGADELALHDTVLAGVVRLVTNPRIFSDPAPMPTALDFIARIRAARRARWLPSSDAAWTGACGAIWGQTRYWQRWPAPTAAGSRPPIAASPGSPASTPSTPQPSLNLSRGVGGISPHLGGER
jgi:hypothetical protein